MTPEEYAEIILKSITEHKTLEPEEQADFLISAIFDVTTKMSEEVSGKVKALEDKRRKENLDENAAGYVTDREIADLFREQYMIWRRMCKALDKGANEAVLDPEGWKDIVRKRFPEVYDYLQKKGWK